MSLTRLQKYTNKYRQKTNKENKTTMISQNKETTQGCENNQTQNKIHEYIDVLP